MLALGTFGGVKAVLAEPTRIVLPPVLAGHAKVDDPRLTQAIRGAASVFESEATVAISAYGQPRNGLMVMGVTMDGGLSEDDRRDFAAGVENAAQLLPGQLVFTSVPPGELGGEMRCGSSVQPQIAMCWFTDDGAAGIVMVSGQEPAAAERTARKVREDVELKG